MKIRTLIVDDEPVARRGLRAMLKAAPDIEIIGESVDGLQAIEEISTKTPDLVFLDIQMPEVDGFGVIETLGLTQRPFFIFVTAYDDFALRAFRVHALDYLLKPVKAKLLQSALDHARQMLARNVKKENDPRVTALLHDFSAAKRYVERLVIKSTGNVMILKVDEVDWFEAYGDYVRIHRHGKKELLREKISELERRLDPAHFLRIHRSAIVKIDSIKEMQPLTNGDYAVILRDGASLALSRTYREKFFAHLQ